MKDTEIPEPKISKVEKKRLKKYFHGMSLYEYVSDVARPLVRYYYSRTDKTELSEKEERVLVAKCLQLKPWWEIHDGDVKAFKALLKAIQKIWRWYDAAGED